MLKAGPDNIAPLAKVTAASAINNESGPQKVTDGLIHIRNKGEWISNSGMTSWGYINYPWIQLDWDHPVTINKVVIYDTPSELTHIAGGVLHFSDGSEEQVLLIPNDGSPRVVTFNAKKVEWLRLEVTDADGIRVGLSEIEVFPAPEDYKDYVSWVDPYTESARGRYFFFITGNQPFGMIGAAPLTRNKNQYGGGYNYNSLEVLGFPQVHCWMLSGITLMPTTGDIDPSAGEQKWKSKFSHDDEIVQPGYHRLYLKDYNIWVELTATDRVSFYRLTYTKDVVSKILLNLGGYVGTSTMTDGRVMRVSDSEVEGEVNTTGRLWGGPRNVKIYFVAQFDRPYEALDGWIDQDKLFNISQLTGKSGSTPKLKEGISYHDAPSSGVSASYSVKAGDQVQVKFAVSYTSIENARKNLISECNHWDFDKVRRDSRDEWNQWLGRIDVKGGTDVRKIKFYTDLWHALLGRHKLDDVNGDYPDNTQGVRTGSFTDNIFKVRTLPKTVDGKVKFHMYNSDAFWLTQWNLNILWGLAWPEVLDEIAASLVQYADNGKLLPRGPCGGGYSYIMTGCPATNLIVSAYTKGILKKTDALHAFDVMKFNHMPGGMMGIDEYYLKNGYHPGNAGITLEANFQDWALAQMAKGLKKKKDESYFLKRSAGWKNIYNDQQKLIFPKDKNGQWLHNDPLRGSGWIEANSWQGTWSVSHDIADLAIMMGGNDSLCNKLNYAFEMAAPQDFVFGYGGGYVSYANQPGCSNAHVFNYAGKPWLSQYWVRRVNEQAYGAITPDKGYGGHDEDQGQMGGVSALMAIGLFSLTGTASINPVYDITSPVFDEVTISLDKSYYEGGKFVIRTYDNSEKNCYIQRASLNGKPLNQFWISHSDFIKGGLLELWLGSEPNKNWGTGIYPPE
ncbi:MAG TPA: glycoside hydrolase [Bacteroidales bacterium]|nr:glycoside hydrolase [Bacteroidales bacterium]